VALDSLSTPFSAAVGELHRWQHRYCTMRIEFKEEERHYILDDPETDLVLTEVGMRLVDGFGVSGGVILVEAPEREIQMFLDELRGEFIRKIHRIARPSLLRGLARRLLPDYDDITSLTDHSLFGE
jgi:hypothetical protein